MISAILLACLFSGYALLHLAWALQHHKPTLAAWSLLLGAGLPLAYLGDPSVWLRMGLRVMALILALSAISTGNVRAPGFHRPLCLVMAALAVAASLH